MINNTLRACRLEHLAGFRYLYSLLLAVVQQ
jgi:hypothetical protein